MYISSLSNPGVAFWEGSTLNCSMPRTFARSSSFSLLGCSEVQQLQGFRCMRCPITLFPRLARCSLPTSFCIHGHLLLTNKPGHPRSATNYTVDHPYFSMKLVNQTPRGYLLSRNINFETANARRRIPWSTFEGTVRISPDFET